MSAPSITASRTNFCDVMSHVNISSERNSGYDTPVPRARISDETTSFFARNAKNTMLVKPAGHLENKCMSTNS